MDFNVTEWVNNAKPGKDKLIIQGRKLIFLCRKAFTTEWVDEQGFFHDYDIDELCTWNMCKKVEG